MNTAKKIAWSSWSALEEAMVLSETPPIPDFGDIDPEEVLAEEAQMLSFMPIFSQQESKLLHTPLGFFPIDSPLKPSDRWDCRIGHTNFEITQSTKDILNRIDGVEALKVLGRYTFFIGIATMFKFKDVRVDIEKQLCSYTEQEVLDEETKITVDLVRDQLETNKYWSILVTSSGKVDYVVSNSLDQAYLDGLNKLLEAKNELGGIILRGDHG
tara:strand:- start:370 stop:1008 length:639 start_codon:yes stop_codon:yes gene_type:complete